MAFVGAALVACGPSDPPPRRQRPAEPGVTSPADRHPWNAAQIDWQSFDDGLARARAEHKPICLVVYTTWCPHCKNYSRVFEDARVVERARDFVMIRIDADQEPEIAARFAEDGKYIPRTFFLAPDGTPDLDIRASRPRYRYFYDEHDPTGLLVGMGAARLKLRD
ncbi:MAG: thioredoxin family protein [Deltaproteobacteria bacterium]|nr:thioredoxin family protein [Deltaproteobacteria bacterium]